MSHKATHKAPARKTFLTILGGLLTLPLAAFGMDLDKKVDFNIPAQELSNALIQFSKQAGLQVVLADEVVGQATRGVSGQHAIKQALNQLLAPAGLNYRIAGESTISVAKFDDSTKTTQDSRDGSQNQLRVAQSGAGDSKSTGQSHAGAQGSEKPESTPSPNMDHSSGERLEEVVVTAQKRAERLQDVPISISVLSGTHLDRSAEDVTAVLRQVPGVTTMLGPQGGTTHVTVRGVTAASATQTGSSTVGYYLDSVPFGTIRNAISPDSNAFDLERIEVLRGPQGTLYGASSSNGVVRVLTKDANLDNLEVKARALTSGTLDGGENYRGDMALNVPIVKGRLAVRAVAGYQDLDGWIDRVNHQDANNEKKINFRFKVNAQPTDNLSIGLSSWTSRFDSDARSTGAVNRTNISKVDEPIATDYDTYGLKVGYEFPGFSLSSMTSYLDYENSSWDDHEAIFGATGPFGRPDTVLLTAYDSRVFSEEVNLASADAGPWRWTAGAIYRDVSDRFRQWRRQYASPGGNISDDTSRSFAVFGEMTRSFADGKYEITGGLRYFEDKGVTQEVSRLNQAPANLSPGLRRVETTHDAVSPRATLTWHATDHQMFYASYAEGFRSGFAQLGSTYFVAPQFPTVKPDTLKNHEVGGKGTLWNGRLGYEAAAYYIDWTNLQQIVTIQTTSGTGSILNIGAPVNAGTAGGLGYEFGLTLNPFTGLLLGINYGRSGLEVDADVIDSLGRLLYKKGDRLQFSPDETFGASADYSFPLGSRGYNGRFSVSGNYSSEITIRALINGASTVLTSDSLLIARTSFAIDSQDRWSATLFVDNLNDENGSPGFDTNAAQQNIRIRPRTVGVQFEYRY
jgi:iron complex outermembrane recepter protein